MSVLDVVALEGILQEHAALMEERQGDDSLHDTDSLSTKDTPQSELGRVSRHFLEGIDCRDGLASDGVGLHNDLETREWVGNDDVDGRHDGGRNEASHGPAEASLFTKLGLDVLLQTGLTD